MFYMPVIVHLSGCEYGYRNLKCVGSPAVLLEGLTLIFQRPLVKSQVNIDNRFICFRWLKRQSLTMREPGFGEGLDEPFN